MDTLSFQLTGSVNRVVLLSDLQGGDVGTKLCQKVGDMSNTLWYASYKLHSLHSIIHRSTIWSERRTQALTLFPLASSGSHVHQHRFVASFFYCLAYPSIPGLVSARFCSPLASSIFLILLRSFSTNLIAPILRLTLVYLPSSFVETGL